MFHSIYSFPNAIRNPFFHLALLALFFPQQNISAQPNFTANDKVEPYAGAFRAGYNPGWHPGWNDQTLGNLAAGNPAVGLTGAGAKTVRQGLYFELLRTWGTGVRLPELAHFQSIGMEEFTALLLGGANGGSQPYPPDDVRDLTQYCPGQPSDLFANLHRPIWDGGANGTAYDDQNYFAAYVYETVKTYKNQIRFWEIWNEPGFDYTGDTGWRPKGDPAGNWWDTNPDPCDYRLRAPIFHYVRMLRIAWEIIKTLDPDSYVCLSSPGYQSFLDAILRNTDNPTDGSVSSDFPLFGGAYFDCLAYHSYPHFDGSTVISPVPPVVYRRNSDQCADGVAGKRDYFQQVLTAHSYDGVVFPKKEFIVTEINLPRKTFGNAAYFSTAEMQRNFTIKSVVNSKIERIHQLHFFTLAEQKTEAAANYEFQMMGLYKNLDNVAPANVQPNDAAIALKTASDLLFDTEFDAAETAKLAPPPNVRAAAFRRADGKFVYVLWAKTLIDKSESAAATYSFPVSLLLQNGQRHEWDWSKTKATTSTNGKNLALTASPIFIIGKTTSGTAQPDFSHLKLEILPNPVGDSGAQVRFFLFENGATELSLFDASGRLQRLVFSGELATGAAAVFLPTSDLPSGVYFLVLKTGRGVAVARFVR